MSIQIRVENIKCGGCASTISKQLSAMPGVSGVKVDIENGEVGFEGDGVDRDAVVERLAQLGYPESGSVEGIRAATAKAKSFVSCAVGRMDSDAD